MIIKTLKRLLTVGLVSLFGVGTGHSTMLVGQKEVSVSRTLAGHAEVGATNVPANGVTVELCSSDWKTVLVSTKTDEKGYFSLEKPETEKLFYIRFSAPGMDICQFRVRVKKHAASELTIHLSVATYHLDRSLEAVRRPSARISIETRSMIKLGQTRRKTLRHFA
jgi:hypothetical protein